MNERRDEHDTPLTTEQEAARKAVRGLRRPEADDDFRTRLRASFVSGDFVEGATDRGDDRRSDLHARRPERTPAPRTRRGGVRWRLTAGVAVAAALLIALGIGNRGPSWEVLAVGANEYVTVDGELVPCDDLSPLQAALRPGCRIEVPEGGRVEVASADHLLLELGGGVDVTVPSPPGRWFGKAVSSRLRGDGTLRVVTGSAFEGASYRIVTDSTEFTVSGTAFSVMHGPEQVCLCVLEGSVEASLPDGSVKSVGPGGRLTIGHDGQLVDQGEMLPAERAALESLRSRARSGH